MEDLHRLLGCWFVGLLRGSVAGCWLECSSNNTDQLNNPNNQQPTTNNCYSSAAMAVDQELLEILACPLCKEEVKVISLSDPRRASVRDKYREKFRGEEPVVEQGLQCIKCRRIYPIVSDIPVMLVDEAFDEA
jgi:uncharacterized protein YbaR (Trm112 family)